VRARCVDGWQRGMKGGGWVEGDERVGEIGEQLDPPGLVRGRVLLEQVDRTFEIADCVLEGEVGGGLVAGLRRVLDRLGCSDQRHRLGEVLGEGAADPTLSFSSMAAPTRAWSGARPAVPNAP